MKKTFLALLISFTSIQSFANNENISLDEWNGMINNFTSLKNVSKTPFQKWHVDIVHFNLLTCSNRFKLPLPDILKNHKVSKGGSYVLIEDSTCISLKKDLSFISCGKITANENPFTRIPTGFHLYQGIFVHPDKSIPKPNSKINVSVKCKLGRDNTKTEQLYHGEATILYDKMRPNKFNTQQGYQNVLQASIMLKIDGLNDKIGPTNLIQLK